jgi:hypothetical protein
VGAAIVLFLLDLLVRRVRIVDRRRTAAARVREIAFPWRA